jgi:penicillin-binding protein 1C
MARKKITAKAGNSSIERLARNGIGPAARKQWIITGGVVFALLVFFILLLPDPLFSPTYSTVIFAKGGELLGASIAADGQWRFPPGGAISSKFARALVAFEDKRFYSHTGIDFAAMLRASVYNLSARRIVSGGSTITMQVIRLALGSRERTIGAKLAEMFLASRFEMSLSKGEILALFAAHAPFGGNVVGLSAASWRYFGRSPDRLSWAEAAMLAVLPNNPGLVYPGKNRDLLLVKRNRLLAQLLALHEIDDETYALSMAEPLPEKPFPLPQHAVHLLEKIRKERPDSARSGILTTVDFGIQKRVNQVASKFHGEYVGYGIKNLAAVVLDVDSGDILAYLGNIYDDEKGNQSRYVDIASAPRSTGSLLKPFLFAACLDSGEIYQDQLLMDIPSRLGSYIPENNTKTYAGAVPASDALVKSLNIPFVLLLRTFGVDRFSALLKDLGMTTLIRSAQEYGLPLIVGGAEGTLAELTGMYAGLCRTAKGGLESKRGFFPPRYVKNDQPQSRAMKENPISPPAAWMTLSTLLDLVRPGEEGAWREFLSSKKIAWKTGTSYGFKDAWAIGVTSKYAVGVWVGNASGEGRPEIRGAHVAAPVLFEIFSGLDNTDWISKPNEGFTLVNVCAQSGFPRGPSCAKGVDAYAPSTAKVYKVCPFCRIVHLDRTGRWQVTSNCESVSEIRNESWFSLTPAMEWYYKKSNASYKPLPPFKKGCSDGSPLTAINLLYPEEGAILYIPIELDGKPGKTVAQAVHRDPNAVIYWHMDGMYFGETSSFHQIEFRIGGGKHRITIVDGTGNTIERMFTILSEK